jgi:type II secretory pathway predicted ATPase ExeA
MYLEFFGLRELPFELTPNPKFVFMTARHREALSNLQYGLTTKKAITLLVGEVGTGKTTLLRTALDSAACRHIKCVYVSNPALTRDEFVETLARGFGLSAAAGSSKATMLSELADAVTKRRAAGGSLALVIDEAQAMSDALLEEIRLLANLETTDEKLLPLVLTGQPELSERLRQDQLRQLRQRVSLRCEISAFEQTDTFAYIAHRIRVAGGQAARIFTREAVALIHERARGIPRVVNVLCDNALVGAFAEGASRVNLQIVTDVCRDFDLGEGRGSAPAPVVQFPAPAAETNETVDELPAEPTAAPAVDADRSASAGITPSARPDESTTPAPDLFNSIARERRFFLFR